jgi:hypothetical protein
LSDAKRRRGCRLAFEHLGSVPILRHRTYLAGGCQNGPQVWPCVVWQSLSGSGRQALAADGGGAGGVALFVVVVRAQDRPVLRTSLKTHQTCLHQLLNRFDLRSFWVLSALAEAIESKKQHVLLNASLNSTISLVS